MLIFYLKVFGLAVCEIGVKNNNSVEFNRSYSSLGSEAKAKLVSLQQQPNMITSVYKIIIFLV